MIPNWRQSTWGSEIGLEYGKGIRDYSAEQGQFRVYGTNGPVGWSDASLAPGPGVILGRKGAYRGVHFSKEPFFVIDTAYYVVPKTPLDMRWVYYAIIYHKLGEIDDGSPIPSTTRSAVYVRDLEVPPITEQRAIASVLEALDDKIDVNQRINDTLMVTARTFFKDWFQEFGPTKAKISGSEPYLPNEIWSLFPSTLNDSIPQGWRPSRVGNFLSLAYGKALRAQDRRPGSVPVFGSNGRVGYHDEALVSGPGIVVGRKGNPGTVKYVNEDFFCIDTTFYVVPKKPWTPAFLWLLLENVDLLHVSADSAVPGLNRDIAYGVECIEPDSTVASAFEAMVSPLLSKVARNEDENVTLATLRDALLPQLISGQLRVKEAEKTVQEAL